MDAKKALEQLSLLGFLVDDEAFDFLKTIDNESDLKKVIDIVIQEINKSTEKPLIISKDVFQKISFKLTPKKEIGSYNTAKTFKPLAAEYSSNLKVISDPTNMIGSEGTVEDFHKYFCSRFEKMSRILKERMDVRDAGTIRSALKASQNSKVKFIAMITEKRGKDGKIFLMVEDLEDSATVLIPENVLNDYPTNIYLTLDQVLCFEVVKGRNDLFIAKNIIYPDVPERKIEIIENPLSVLLISDIHFGSKTFMDKIFNRMIFWLNGKIGNEKQINKASAIKYLVIAGDLVDGIGIYPNQENELLITDIYEQYRLVAQYLEQIPDYIEVIIIPGNHDATSQVLPQPAILEDYIEPIYEARKIVSLGNPSQIKIDERSFLIYHGNNLIDIASIIPGVNIDRPEKGVEHLLKIRHLAPEFGAKTPISPELDDLLVIEKPPDVIQTGHLHKEGHLFYRGSQIVCCGAWQGQTNYQKTLGIKPTIGAASIIDLKDVGLSILNFAEAL